MSAEGELLDQRDELKGFCMKNNISKLIMVSMAVNDMPAMKEFCVDKLGFQIATEYRQDDSHWWTSVELAGDGLVVTLSTFDEGKKPGTMMLYLLAPDIEAAHNDLDAKGLKPTPIAGDLYGPGSGVKWFSVNDPEGNTWMVAQALASWM